MTATTETPEPHARNGPDDVFSHVHKRLSDERKWHTFKQGEVAEALTRQGFDIKQATVSSYERDPRRLTNLSPDFVTAFLREYRIPTDEAEDLAAQLFLAAHEGTFRFISEHAGYADHHSEMPAGVRSIPVYSSIGAGPGGQDGIFLRNLELTADEPGDVAYEVNGNSMEPDIPHGSTVVVKRGVFDLGDIVVAWVPDEGMVVKRLVVSRPEHRAVLTSSNPNFGALIAEGATIFGKVVEHRKRHK